MFIRKLHRLYGLTWCQWKGALQQNMTLHSLEKVRQAFSARGHQRCAWMSSSVFSRDNHTVSGDPAEGIPHELTEKGMGRFHEEQDLKLMLKPDQPENPRILRVAVIGLPNSGKSTLTNSLMGWRVSSVSKKVHTTQKNTMGIYTQGNTQLLSPLQAVVPGAQSTTQTTSRVFLDTPGVLSPTSRKRHNLERTLLIDPERSLDQADLVCVVTDVSNKWTRSQLDPLILQVLHLHQDVPAVLVLNKVDLLKSKAVLLHMTRMLTGGVVDDVAVSVRTKKTGHPPLDLDALFNAADASKGKHVSVNHPEQSPPSLDEESITSIEEDDCSSGDQTETPRARNKSLSEAEAWTAYFQKMREAGRAVRDMRGWPHFKQIFMVSALSGDGVAEVKDYLLRSAKPGSWDYHSSLVTSQEPREVVFMCIREKLLEHLQQEVPYSMSLDIVLWEVDEDGIFNVMVNVCAENGRQMSSLLGPRGLTIQKIAQEAKQEMMNTFRCEMRLKLIAKIKRR